MKNVNTGYRQAARVSEKLRADIHEIAEETYDALADRYNRARDIVHRVGLCVPASTLMQEGLAERGHEAFQVCGPDGSVYHYYVALPGQSVNPHVPEDKDILVDPTWQQFISKDEAAKIPETLPKVLIGTSSDIIGVAHEQGLGPNVLAAYTM